ncbi:hypothetical protein DFP73DRAFT_587881, partial [Morchella snyderi]
YQLHKLKSHPFRGSCFFPLDIHKQIYTFIFPFFSFFFLSFSLLFFPGCAFYLFTFYLFVFLFFFFPSIYPSLPTIDL